MDLQLNDKTALVTGASQGIGRAIAKALAAEGVKLCVVARRRQLLDELAKEIVAAGGSQPHIVTLDLIDEDAPQRLAQAAIKALGRVDILINSAGGSRAVAMVAPEETWVEGMTLNFTRLRQITQELLPDMIKNKWGRIINITGKSEFENLNVANSAKAGVHAWAKGLSREIGKHSVTINCVTPGRILTEQTRLNYSEQVRKEFAEREIPLGRFGEPEELASVAVFLTSPLANYVTGAVIPVDGGMRRYAY